MVVIQLIYGSNLYLYRYKGDWHTDCICTKFRGNSQLVYLLKYHFLTNMEAIYCRDTCAKRYQQNSKKYSHQVCHFFPVSPCRNSQDLQKSKHYCCVGLSKVSSSGIGTLCWSEWVLTADEFRERLPSSLVVANRRAMFRCVLICLYTMWVCA